MQPIRSVRSAAALIGTFSKTLKRLGCVLATQRPRLTTNRAIEALDQWIEKLYQILSIPAG